MAYETEQVENAVGKGEESERAARVYRDIDAYVNKGGRDLEDEHLALAESDEEKEKIRNLWHKGRRARLALVGARFEALRPKIEAVRCKLAEPAQVEAEEQAKPKVSWRRTTKTNFFAPSTQPTVESSEKDDREEKPPKELSDAGVVPTGFRQSPTIAPALADEGVLCLDPAAPFDNAQKLVSLRAWHPSERIRTWQFWQKSFWQWSGTHWCEVDDDTVRASIWHELNGAEKVLKGGKRARYEPKINDVNATLDALRRL